MEDAPVATDLTIAVVFALEREAAPFRRAARGLPHVSIHVSGVGRELAGAAAERATADSLPELLIAAGFCGALWPATRVGAVLSPAEVVDESGKRWVCDHRSGGGRLLTSGTLVGDPADKRSLRTLYTADAVDMESAAVAEVCAARGVRFLAVRAVSDAADTALSPELVRLLSGGNVSVLRACGALLRKPRLLGEFLRLARDTRLAARNLADAIARLVEDETLALRARVSN